MKGTPQNSLDNIELCINKNGEQDMYIVTGGAGMIGSAVIWALNQRGIDDILVVDNLATSEKWKNLVSLRYASYMNRDAFIQKIRDNSFTKTHIQGIIHMGACSRTTEANSDFLMENNTHYSQDFYAWAQKFGVRFITASSAATYGDGANGFSNSLEILPKLRPLNMYGYSKHLFDLWCLRKKYFDNIVSLKFFNVYGPNEYHKGEMRSVICKSLSQVAFEGVMRLFASDKPNYANGGQLRDFIYIKDCAKLVVWFLLDTQIGGLFNVGSGKARPWNDVAKALFAAVKKEENIEYIAMPKIFKGKYQYFTEADMSWMNEAKCPITFTSLEDGIQEYVREYMLTPNPYLSTI